MISTDLKSFYTERPAPVKNDEKIEVKLEVNTRTREWSFRIGDGTSKYGKEESSSSKVSKSHLRGDRLYLLALTEALKEVSKLLDENTEKPKVYIDTDSIYLKNYYMYWKDRWTKQEFKDRPNSDLLSLWKKYEENMEVIINTTLLPVSYEGT